MSNISGQLIKDSYNYILQSDVNTGFVYRVGGGVPSNPIFSSGLTISGAAFTYNDGNQQAGYVLTSDASGNAAWGPVSGSSTGKFVEISGSTMTGRLYNQSGITVTGDVTTDYVIAKGITATTISATTLHIENDADISAGSINADTYSGNTIIVNNFTAITVSATTYLNLPDSADTKVTGFSLNNNVITLSQNRTDQYSAFTISLSAYTGNTSTSGDYLPLSGGTVSGNTIFQSGLTTNTLTITGLTSSTDSNVVTVDGSGILHTYPISGLTGNTFSGNDGASSGRWILDNTTTPPTTGKFYTTATDMTGITSIDISYTANTNTDYTGWFGLIQFWKTTTAYVYVTIEEVGNNSNISLFYVSSIIDNASYFTINLSSLPIPTGSGILNNTSEYTISFVNSGPDGGTGAPGPQGNDGANSGRWTFTTSSTAFSNPGSGKFNSDSNDFSLITGVSISYEDYVTTILYGWLSVLRNSQIDGYTPILQIRDLSTLNNVGTYTVGTIVDNTTWFDLPLTLISSNGYLGDNSNYSISWVLNGKNGTGGSGDYLPLSGGTVTGDTIFQSGITATTISATTYYNVNAVTGGTYSSGTITLSGTGSVNGNTITGLNTGTVTSITSGTGMSFSNITTSGSVSIDTTKVPYYSSTPSNGLLKYTSGTWGIDTSTYLTSAITSLGGLTGATQTFGNDTNVTMVSSGTTHTLTWSGTLADARIASATNWNTAYTNRITTLTVTGNSGNATLSSNTLNIPTYTLSGLGGQPLSTNLTSLSGLSYASTSFVKMTASGTFGLDTNTYLTSAVTAATLSAANVLSVTLNGGSPTTTTVNAVTGGTYSNGVITLSGTGSFATSITGFSTSTATAFTGGTVSGATNFTGGVTANTLTVSAATDPVKFVGLQSASDTSLLTVDGTGVIHTLSTSSVGLSWNNATATQSATANNGYVGTATTLTTITLPTSATFGSIIEVVGTGTGFWRLSQNASQSIKFGVASTATGTGGYLSATSQYDCVKLLCTSANTTFVVTSSIGNIFYI